MTKTTPSATAKATKIARPDSSSPPKAPTTPGCHNEGASSAVATGRPPTRRGWRVYFTDIREVAIYCPDCAGREFRGAPV